MYYTNYLLNNLPSLLKVEVAEDQTKFLGVSFNYKGYDWSAHVDGHRVCLHIKNGKGIKVTKSIFTVGKKEETNKKHVEEIERFMNVVLAYSRLPVLN